MKHKAANCHLGSVNGSFLPRGIGSCVGTSEKQQQPSSFFLKQRLKKLGWSGKNTFVAEYEITPVM